ncbi:uncharacterized protein A4U43_C07F380 [Asparagus officinalis]|uniref:Uncharacterized protein n=1 Tax=Asparagus officinalis TaxID=4686 RepID=A0A5P1E8D5_ASPOF|nr:uncharacterized protein A4U43_C07F380 [Asparagus officinalis]
MWSSIGLSSSTISPDAWAVTKESRRFAAPFSDDLDLPAAPAAAESGGGGGGRMRRIGARRPPAAEARRSGERGPEKENDRIAVRVGLMGAGVRGRGDRGDVSWALKQDGLEGGGDGAGSAVAGVRGGGFQALEAVRASLGVQRQNPVKLSSGWRSHVTRGGEPAAGRLHHQSSHLALPS